MKTLCWFFVGLCSMIDVASAYTVGNFVAPRGPQGLTGNACQATETRTRCGDTGADACGDTSRSGFKIVRTDCFGAVQPAEYLYDNDCGITVASVADVHQDNDQNKPVTHKRVNFANTCGGVTPPSADIPVGQNGQNGSNCEADVIVTACGPEGSGASVRCADTSKVGVRITKNTCAGTLDTNFTPQYVYNGSSVFDIWKAQQINNTTCQGLFGKDCANLTEADMLQDLSAYGNWARTTYATNSSADLSQTAYQNSLKPCQSYTVTESVDQSGTDGGKRYDLVCND